MNEATDAEIAVFLGLAANAIMDAARKSNLCPACALMIFRDSINVAIEEGFIEHDEMASSPVDLRDIIPAGEA